MTLYNDFGSYGTARTLAASNFERPFQANLQQPTQKAYSHKYRNNHCVQNANMNTIRCMDTEI